MTEVQCPDFIKIMNDCKNKMAKSYKKYGNSWVDNQTFSFWKDRLNGEIIEIFEAKTFKDYQKEIIDAINILSMMHDKHDDWFFRDKEIHYQDKKEK